MCLARSSASLREGVNHPSSSVSEAKQSIAVIAAPLVGGGVDLNCFEYFLQLRTADVGFLEENIADRLERFAVPLQSVDNIMVNFLIPAGGRIFVVGDESLDDQ